uniref:Uncharacterized protein n=1 Tax=Arundo donax TaxID=35708 RepID=A0A0A8YIX8_ARUDO
MEKKGENCRRNAREEDTTNNRRLGMRSLIIMRTNVSERKVGKEKNKGSKIDETGSNTNILFRLLFVTHICDGLVVSSQYKSLPFTYMSLCQLIHKCPELKTGLDMCSKSVLL